jgi:hypothetical protein
MEGYLLLSQWMSESDSEHASPNFPIALYPRSLVSLERMCRLVFGTWAYFFFPHKRRKSLD